MPNSRREEVKGDLRIKFEIVFPFKPRAEQSVAPPVPLLAAPPALSLI